MNLKKKATSVYWLEYDRRSLCHSIHSLDHLKTLIVRNSHKNEKINNKLSLLSDDVCRL